MLLLLLLLSLLLLLCIDTCTYVYIYIYIYIHTCIHSRPEKDFMGKAKGSAKAVARQADASQGAGNHIIYIKQLYIANIHIHTAFI